jgi:uncharacterized sulfatase
VNRRHFLQQAAAGTAGIWAGAHLAQAEAEGAAGAQSSRVNLLFVIADDWSWPHAAIYGAGQVSTPNFDRVAREGLLSTQAFTAAPQCSPNRAATLTGRHIWQIEEAGTHASIFPKRHAVYPDLLEAAGYHVGYTGKGWGPGDWRLAGWDRNPAGTEYRKRRLEPPQPGINNVDYAGNFADFLESRPDGAPFHFWLGTGEPHRDYMKGAGIAAGKDPAQVEVPPFLPDTPEVRSDLLDYFTEVEWFDQQLGAALQVLEEKGEAENTLVVVTSDNGMPFPRAKATVYEYGTHVPLAMRWPGKIAPGQTLEALVSFVDFAPTFLEAANVAVPPAMNGRSLLPLLTGATHAAERGRSFVQTGRERHTHARFDNLGYPSRTLRTQDYLYIRNFKPDRWPMGDPPGYKDIDDSPTLQYMQEHEAEHPKLWELAVGKRPEEELYDIRRDPACMDNLVGMAEHSEVLKRLRATLEGALSAQQDPRMLGTGDIFESYPRVSGMRPELGGFAERGKYNPKYVP